MVYSDVKPWTYEELLCCISFLRIWLWMFLFEFSLRYDAVLQREFMNHEKKLRTNCYIGRLQHLNISESTLMRAFLQPPVPTERCWKLPDLTTAFLFRPLPLPHALVRFQGEAQFISKGAYWLKIWMCWGVERYDLMLNHFFNQRYANHQYIEKKRQFLKRD